MPSRCDKTGDPRAIEAELASNLVPNARMVPAGVVGVQRVQKAGFAYTFAGLGPKESMLIACRR
jgi:hypothetical protein